jgi:hypothetical protein
VVLKHREPLPPPAADLRSLGGMTGGVSAPIRPGAVE